jgi:parallel beta-helix repeat protein
MSLKKAIERAMADVTSIGKSGSTVTFEDAVLTKKINNIRIASQFATSGSGTSADPWLGAIQLAIDDLPDTGGTVYVPAGHYTESAIELRGTSEGKTKVSVIGAGIGNTVVKCPDNTNENVFEIGYNNGGKPGGGSDFYIGHLSIDGNKANNTKQSANYPNGDTAEYRQNGIWTWDAYHVLIENVYVYDVCFNGFGNHGSNVAGNGEDIMISNCRSSGCLWIGFQFWNYIKYSSMVNCLSDGDYTGHGIEIHSHHNSIVGCKAINSTDTYGISIFDDSYYNVINGCIAKNNNLDGIAIRTNGCSNNSVSNCVSEGNSNGIMISDSDHNTVSACVAEGNTLAGVLITNNADYNIIDSCSANGNTADGIRISGNACIYNKISNCVISGNMQGITLWGGAIGDHSYNSITGNILEDNGIYMRYDVSLNIFSNNIIQNCTLAIEMYSDVTNCSFSNNFIDGCSYGITEIDNTSDYNYYFANRMTNIATRKWNILGTHSELAHNMED